MLGVIVGGLIAILAGIAVPFVQHRLTEASRKEAERRANVIELIGAIYDLDEWLDQQRKIDAFGDTGTISSSPLAKVEAMVRVHFPEAHAAFRTLKVVARESSLWAVSRKQERIASKPLDLSAYEDLSRRYALAHARLIDAICGDPPSAAPRDWHAVE